MSDYDSNSELQIIIQIQNLRTYFQFKTPGYNSNSTTHIIMSFQTFRLQLQSHMSD